MNADKSTKKVCKYFTIFEYEKEQEYLRQMHRSGWKLVKVTGLTRYHFEKCEPEDVIYQLDYNPQGAEQKEEYIQMFADCGWEYLQDYAGYSYFRKPAAAPGSDEIFCDDESRLQMMKRVFKDRFLPLFIILSLLLVPQFIGSLFDGDAAVAVVLGIMIALYVWVFLTAARQYFKYKHGRR